MQKKLFGGSKIVRLLPKIWLFLGGKICAPFCALFGQIRCAFEFRIINHSAYDLILHFWGLYNFNLYLPNCPTWNEHFLHCQPLYFPLTFREKKIGVTFDALLAVFLTGIYIPTWKTFVAHCCCYVFTCSPNFSSVNEYGCISIYCGTSPKKILF